MHLLSVGRALPPHRYSQAELTEAFAAYFCPDKPRIARRLASFHESAQVEHRHLARPREEYAGLRDFGARNDVYIEVALELGEQAIRDALTRAGIAPGEVDAIFFVSVTGVAVPTLDARLISRLGFRHDIKRNPLFGLGCVAGAAGTARMADYLRAFPEQVAVLLSVELCSLTLLPEDLSVPNLIGSGLFGDGAAAVVGVGAGHPKASGPKVCATRSRFYPGSEHAMGWAISSRGFGLELSADVPSLVREHLRDDVDTFLASQGMKRSDIHSWLSHPGGPKVLEAIEAALELAPDALDASWRSLRAIGNLSSASVLWILEEALAERRIPSGAPVMMMAMGPGFCAELVLLQW